VKRESLVIGGGVLAAIGASLCCIGPLLFVALGIGAFGAASVFESARPYLLGAAVLALAFGFYRTYFRRESRAPGEVCATKPINRASRAALWVASVAVLAFALASYYVGYIAAAIVRSRPPVTVPAVAPTANSQSFSSLETITVEVEGMDCSSCEMPIKAALERTPGVRAAIVSYERGNARVEYDSNQTDVNQIRSAIDSTGFKSKR